MLIFNYHYIKRYFKNIGRLSVFKSNFCQEYYSISYRHFTPLKRKLLIGKYFSIKSEYFIYLEHIKTWKCQQYHEIFT